MKRFLTLLSLSAMLALALHASPADAKSGKKGPGFHKQHAGVKVTKVMMSPGKRITNKRLLLDGQRRHFFSNAPPPRRQVLRRHARRAGHTWIPGTWRFSHRVGRYVWVDGYWVRTRLSRRWVQGYWGHTPHGWHFVAGYWRR